jgi:AcrR family transcriptional regulator
VGRGPLLSGAEPERAKLRRAALELAVERGYTELDRAAVIERAGLDPAAFDRHYADLEACMLDAYQDAFEAMFAAITEATSARSGWLEQMRALGPAVIEFLRSDQERARYLTVEVVSGGERIRLAREADLARICELIDRGREHSPDPEAIPEGTAMIVAGTIFLKIYQGMLEGNLDSAYETMPEAMHTIVLPYLGERAALGELRRAPPSPPPCS